MSKVLQEIQKQITEYEARYNYHPEYIIIGAEDFLEIINNEDDISSGVVTAQPLTGEFRIFDINVVVESNRRKGSIYVAGTPRREILRSSDATSIMATLLEKYSRNK